MYTLNVITCLSQEHGKWGKFLLTLKALQIKRCSLSDNLPVVGNKQTNKKLIDIDKLTSTTGRSRDFTIFIRFFFQKLD